MRQLYLQKSKIFQLNINGDLAENTPLGLVEFSGYQTKGWHHEGPVVKGCEKKSFFLIKLPFSHLEEVIRELNRDERFKIPPGQWLKPYLEEKNLPGLDPVGVADPSWFFPSGEACFPFVSLANDLDFHNHKFSLGANWWWLVQLSD